MPDALQLLLCDSLRSSLYWMSMYNEDSLRSSPTPSANTDLIRTQLSGVGWRGFDLYKMFRTGQDSRDSNMVDFCTSYLADDAAAAGAEEAKLLVEEAKLFEPVTWLEAGVFFLFAIGEGREGLEGAENEQWEADMEALARDRLGEYASCVEGWESKVEEWRKRFDKAA